MPKGCANLLLILKLFWGLTTCVQAQSQGMSQLILTEDFKSQYINSSIEYQLNNAFDIHSPQFLPQEMDGWKALEGPPSFLFDDRVGWIRFPIANESSNSEWVLELDWPKAVFTASQLFYKSDDSDHFIEIEKNLRHRFFTWQLKLSRFESGVIVVRARAPELLSIPLRIYRADRYAIETLYLTAGISFLISTLLALAVFNLFIGLRSRDETHLWYFLAQFTLGWFFAFYYGLDHEFYFGAPRELIMLWVCCLGYLAILGLFQFLISYMDFRKKYARLYPYVMAMMLSLFLTIGLYGYVHTSVMASMYFVQMGSTLTFILGVALYGAIQGDRLAFYFLLIWFLVGVFLVFFDGQALGLIERTLFTNHSILIGLSLEAVLFSLALGERINALIRENFEAETSAKVKSDFLAQMSHEIRTPMNAIIGMSQLMGLTPMEKKQRFYNNLVQSSAESLLCIINDILDFSKIEAGKLSLEKTSFSLNELLQGVIGIFYSHVKRTQIPLYCSIQPLVPDELQGDPARLRQILINLVGNAFKFTSEGYILLSVAVDPLVPGQVRFSVRDSGVGISGSAQIKLFSAFSQVDSSTSRKYGGTGLGLAISKKLSALMGGQIGVESEEGVGSCFYFTAPLLKQKQVEGGFDLLDSTEAQAITPFHKGERLGDFSHPLRVIVIWARAELCDLLATYFIYYNIRVVRCASRQQLSLQLKQESERLLGVIIDEELQRVGQLQRLGILPAATDDASEEGEEEALFGSNNTYKWVFLTGDIEDHPIDTLNRGTEMCRWGIINRFYNVLVMDNTSETQQYRRSYQTKRSGLKVLVAEDKLTNQEVIRGFMAELGHEINVVENGIQAVQDYKQHGGEYDLILMDCAMPEMDGFEATRVIRKYEKGHDADPIPVVALTAHAFSEHQQQCIHAGMDDHLSKPITLKSLVNCLDRHFPNASL